MQRFRCGILITAFWICSVSILLADTVDTKSSWYIMPGIECKGIKGLLKSDNYGINDLQRYLTEIGGPNGNDTRICIVGTIDNWFLSCTSKGAAYRRPFRGSKGEISYTFWELDSVAESVPIHPIPGESNGSNGTLRDFAWSPGAEHVYLADTVVVKEGSLVLYEIYSDPTYPLTFKLVEDVGYVLLCGRGVVASAGLRRDRVGFNDDVEGWLPKLHSNDQLQREAAAQALGWLATTSADKPNVVTALILALTDSSWQVRRNAAESLGRILDTAAIPALQQATQDKDDWVRDVAEESLAKYSTRK